MTKRIRGIFGLLLAIAWFCLWTFTARELKLSLYDATELFCGPIIMLFGLKLFADRNDKE